MLPDLSFCYLGWCNPKRSAFLRSRFFCIHLCSNPKTGEVVCGPGEVLNTSFGLPMSQNYIECRFIFWTCGTMLQLRPFLPLYTLNQQHTLPLFLESPTVEMAHLRQVSHCIELFTVLAHNNFPLEPNSEDHFLAYTICHTFYETGKCREGPLFLQSGLSTMNSTAAWRYSAHFKFPVFNLSSCFLQLDSFHIHR